MAEIWGVLAAAAVGAGVTLYGANKQAKATQAAANTAAGANQAAIDANWRRYLMTRGVGDNGQAVNTKLPLWASVTRDAGGANPRLTTSSYIPTSSAPDIAAGSGGGGRSLAALMSLKSSRPQLALN